MKEPLKDAFFQPANHPYFVKEKPFWTIDRGSVPKPQQFEASSQPADPSNLIFRCESSRVASVSLSLPSAVSSTWQFLPAPDASHRGRPDGVESDNGASLEADDTASQTGRGNIEPGVIINASTCPSLCRHASFLTDSLNRKNLLGGYFDADNDLDERVSSVREAAAGLSQRRRPRKRCRGAHHEGSDRLPHSTEVDRDNGALSDENEGPKVSDSGRGTRDSSMPDSCSVCSGSSDGSGHIGDVIQPMALKLHLAEEVREDVTKLASSLTRRLFFARQKHEDVSATGSGPTLYHRDSDRSHLNVNTGVGASDCLQTAAASSRNSVGARARAEPDGSTARVRTRSRHAGRGTAHRRRSFEHTFSDVIAQDAGTDRSADCTAPWTTSSSRGNANTHGIYSQFISSSGSSVFASTVEQFGIDETATQRESRDRKRLRRQRRCCRAAVIVASLALLAAVIATVGVLYTVGWLSPAALSTSDSTGNTVVGTSAVTSTMTTARLSSSSTSESVIITFVGALRLMMDFSPEMSDINSSVSRNLSRLFCNAVDRIYHNNSESLSYDPLNGCLVTNFTYGSVIFDFTLVLSLDNRHWTPQLFSQYIDHALPERLRADYGWITTNASALRWSSVRVTRPPAGPTATQLTTTESLPDPKPGCHIRRSLSPPVSYVPGVPTSECMRFVLPESNSTYTRNSADLLTNTSTTPLTSTVVECVCPRDKYNSTSDSCDNVDLCSEAAAAGSDNDLLLCRPGCGRAYVLCRKLPTFGPCNVFVGFNCCNSNDTHCSKERCSGACNFPESTLNLSCRDRSSGGLQ